MLTFFNEKQRIWREYTHGKWTSSLETAAYTQLMESPNRSSLKNFLTIKQSLSGFTASDIESINTLVNANSIKQSPKEHLFLLLLNLDTELMSAQQVQNHLLKYVNKRDYRIALRYLPALLKLLPPDHSMIPSLSTAHQYHSITSKIDKSIAQSAPTSIAIVGNSPCGIGKNRGREIDGAELVIRFNNLGNLEQHKDDYGRRTDLWIVSPSFKLTLTPNICHRIGISGVDPLTRPCRYWESLVSLDAQIFCFRNSLWYQLVRQLEAPPSAGLLMLACVKEALPEGTEVNLHGFSNGIAQSHTANHHADNTQRSSRHNWRLEGRLTRSYMASGFWKDAT